MPPTKEMPLTEDFTPEFGIEEELTEDKRISLIDVFLLNRREIEAIPETRGLTDFGLAMLMNEECLKCQQSRVNKSKCYGRIGAIPCLAFADKEEITYGKMD